MTSPTLLWSCSKHQREETSSNLFKPPTFTLVKIVTGRAARDQTSVPRGQFSRKHFSGMGRLKGRVRVKSVKGKRWKKGQSSSSNPETSKHRNAARGKFTGHLAQGAATQGQGVTLTTDALASHDAIQGEQDEELQLNRYCISWPSAQKLPHTNQHLERPFT